MNICKALLKYGYSNFSLEILEYCDKEKCLEREDYYQTKLNPEYNIAKKAGAPFAGRKHSDETKQIMSDAKKGKTLSDETKKIMSDAAKKSENSGRFKPGENHPNYGKAKYEGAGEGRPCQVIEVTDIKNNTTTTYNSIHEAARALNLPNFQAIPNFIKNNQTKPYKGRYTFKKI
jgi:group I intron endonuclease